MTSLNMHFIDNNDLAESKTKYIVGSACVIFILILFFAPIIPVNDYTKPYAIDEQYIEKELVTHTKNVVTEEVELGAFTYKTIDFSLSEDQNVKIEWASPSSITLFPVMKQKTYDGFYQGLVLRLGAAAALAFVSEGLLTPALITAFVSALPDLLQSVGSVDYFQINLLGDNENQNLISGVYKIVVISFGSSGSVNINISYDYELLEDVIKHRQVTRYEMKMITIWQWLYL